MVTGVAPGAMKRNTIEIVQVRAIATIVAQSPYAGIMFATKKRPSAIAIKKSSA